MNESQQIDGNWSYLKEGVRQENIKEQKKRYQSSFNNGRWRWQSMSLREEYINFRKTCRKQQEEWERKILQELHFNDREKQILMMHIEGKSFREIQEKTNLPDFKSVVITVQKYNYRLKH